jgi:hypothetical protein
MLKSIFGNKNLRQNYNYDFRFKAGNFAFFGIAEHVLGLLCVKKIAVVFASKDKF